MGTDREPLEAAPGTVAWQICDLAGVISITTAAAKAATVAKMAATATRPGTSRSLWAWDT